MGKLPLLFSWDEGQTGRFIKKERVTDAEVNVWYHPPGLLGSLKKMVIKRVPISAVVGPENPPGCPFEEGWVILVCGSRGESWLSDKIGLAMSKNIARLETEKAQIRMENQVRTAEAENLRKGMKIQAKEIKGFEDVFAKPKQPVNPLDRRRLPQDMDEYQ